MNRLVMTIGMALACAAANGCAWLESKAERQAVAAQQWVDQARTAENRLDLCEATECLGRAVDINPTDVEAHRQLGEVLSKQGRYDEALRHLEYAAARDPHDVLVWIALTRALIEQHDPLKAAEAIEQALALEPSNAEALMLQAHLFELRGELEQARMVYNRVLIIHPKHTDGSLKLAALQLQLGFPERAAPLFRSIAHRSDVTAQQRNDAEWQLGIAYGAMQRWPDASATLQNAIANRDASADDWYRLAYAHFQQGHYALSQQALSEALQQDTRHAGAQNMAAALRRVAAAQHEIQHAMYADRLNVPAPSGWNDAG